MKHADMPPFGKMLGTIGELYGKKISKPLTEIYWLALQRFEFDDVKAALNAHVNHPDTGQFMPKPADVVRFIEGSGETRSLKAWTRVEKSISRIGGYQSVAFDDPLIHAVIEDMGGWIELCRVQKDKLPFRANEFQKRYESFISKPPDRYPKYLSGRVECQNGIDSSYSEPPVLIGDSSKAQAVIAGGGGQPLLIHRGINPVTENLKKLSRD